MCMRARLFSGAHICVICVTSCAGSVAQLARAVSEAMAGSVSKIQDGIKKALALAKRVSEEHPHTPPTNLVRAVRLGASSRVGVGVGGLV